MKRRKFEFINDLQFWFYKRWVYTKTPFWSWVDLNVGPVLWKLYIFVNRRELRG